MISSLIVLLAILLVCLGVMLRGRSASDRPTSWFQLASYRDGKVTHLTPMRDGEHAEDEFGQCACRPRAGAYQLDNGSAGTLYIHHTLDRSTR